MGARNPTSGAIFYERRTPCRGMCQLFLSCGMASSMPFVLKVDRSQNLPATLESAAVLPTNGFGALIVSQTENYSTDPVVPTKAPTGPLTRWNEWC